MTVPPDPPRYDEPSTGCGPVPPLPGAADRRSAGVVDLHDTSRCGPAGRRCEACGGEVEGIAVVALDFGGLGVACLSLCPDDAASTVPPAITVGTARRLVAQHAGHVGAEPVGAEPVGAEPVEAADVGPAGPPAAAPAGVSAPPPLEREPWSVRYPWEPDRQFDHLRGSDPTAYRRAVRLDRLTALHEPLAGVVLSEREEAILEWLTGFDVATVAPFVRIVWAARQARPR